MIEFLRTCSVWASCPARCLWESCRHSQPRAPHRIAPIPETRGLESCKHLFVCVCVCIRETKTQAHMQYSNEPGEMKQALAECHTSYRRDLLLQLSFIILKIHFLRDELTFCCMTRKKISKILIKEDTMRWPEGLFFFFLELLHREMRRERGSSALRDRRRERWRDSKTEKEQNTRDLQRKRERNREKD